MNQDLIAKYITSSFIDQICIQHWLNFQSQDLAQNREVFSVPDFHLKNQIPVQVPQIGKKWSSRAWHLNSEKAMGLMLVYNARSK